MPDSEGPSARLPRRELRDPRELRALTHPVRLAMLEQLMLHGPATATELAELLQDQSPANCSWHLRQLARYGYVDEAGTGPGRQRRWRLVVESMSESDDASAELTTAADAFDDLLFEREVAARRAWQSARRAEPQRWQDASLTAQAWAWFTVEEAAQFKAEFIALLERFVGATTERFDPANRPAGSRPVRLVGWLVPTGNETPPDRETGDADTDNGENR